MRKGFTLVELLAVIVILAIILAIAIPGISNVINSSTKGAAESDAKMVLKALEYKMLEDNTFDPTTVNETNLDSLLGLNNVNYDRLTVKKMNGSLYVTIVGKNKWNNITISGTKTKIRIDDTQTTFVRGANAPVLVTGMTPIKWNGSTWVTTTSDDTAWYNYDTTNKIWANAQTADGSMWVWIPRYIYKISTGWHTSTAGTIDVQFTKGIDDNWNKASIGNIDTGETSNASNNKWTNHPAFTFGDTELKGIWVAKFDASSSNPAATYGGGNVTNLKVKSIPNVNVWRYITVNNIFTVTRSMETDNTYGWGTSGSGIDTHMMKNTERGVVVYLAQSIYGKNAEIWSTVADDYTTGCAGDTVNSAATTGCLRTYDTANGQQASTTGNIYGIYDIRGGSSEYMASYLNNGNTNLSNGSILISAEAKYKNVYTSAAIDNDNNNYALAVSSKGDAIYETSSTGSGISSWYTDSSSTPVASNVWFDRGGVPGDGNSSGTFHFYRNTGGTSIFIGFRPILLVAPGL